MELYSLRYDDLLFYGDRVWLLCQWWFNEDRIKCIGGVLPLKNCRFIRIILILFCWFLCITAAIDLLFHGRIIIIFNSQYLFWSMIDVDVFCLGFEYFNIFCTQFDDSFIFAHCTLHIGLETNDVFTCSLTIFCCLICWFYPTQRMKEWIMGY